MAVRLTVRAGKLWEELYPWIIGVALGVGVYIWNPDGASVYKALDKSLNGAVTAAAVLAGFQGTALSMLLALVNTPPIKKLRKLALYRPLVRFHAQAIALLFACVVYAVILLGYMGVHSSFDKWSRYVAAIAAFVSVASSLAAFRVTYLMVVKILGKHGDALSDAE